MAATKAKSKARKSGNTSSGKARQIGGTASATDGTRVHVDDTNRNGDHEAIPGRPARVLKGDNAGVEGVIYEITSYKGKDPDEVVFRPRNEPIAMITEKYSNIEALPGNTFGGRR